MREAWAQVGVEPADAGGTPDPAPQPEPQSEPRPSGRLRVERSGGFVGRTEAVEVDLDDPDLDDPELGDLVRQAVLAPAGQDTPPKPDMFVYTFSVDGRDPVRVPEHLLSASQAELARRVLRPGSEA